MCTLDWEWWNVGRPSENYASFWNLLNGKSYHLSWTDRDCNPILGILSWVWNPLKTMRLELLVTIYRTVFCVPNSRPAQLVTCQVKCSPIGQVLLCLPGIWSHWKAICGERTTIAWCVFLRRIGFTFVALDSANCTRIVTASLQSSP